jgi:glycosyltransferase involved in cell wall biosynthesis
MKVLHVISGDLWAGAEAQAATLLAQLARQPGIRVTVVLLNQGELARRLKALAIDVRVLDEQQLSSPVIFLKLLGLMRKLQPDIVHTHRIKENILASLAATLVTVAKGVRTVHGAAEHSTRGWRNLPRRVRASFDGWCGTHLQTATIAVSKELGRALVRQYPKQNVVIIENGVSADSSVEGVQPPDWKTLSPEALHIGIAGRLVPVKRIDIFIDMAAQLIKNSATKWQFHIFGDGPLRLQLNEQADNHGLGGLLIFHGQVADVSRQLRSLNALIICSDHEGLPMVALEALAVRTPVLAHAVGGLRDLLTEPLLIADNKASCYADTLTQLMQSRTDAGAPLYLVTLPDQYTADHNARQIVALYTRVLAE